MMISPDMYYDMHLKGKSSEQIMSVIRSLKWQIGRLKSSMENPSSDLTVIISPGEDVMLYFSREYLKKAKQAYFEAGGIYAQSKSEEKVANFTANIEFITKITFVKENYLRGYRSFIVEITDEIKIYTRSFDEKSTVLTCVDEGNEPFTKYTFLETLEVLQIGEWRRRYSSKRFGIVEQHGLKWCVEFEYNNGHKSIKFEGENSYPYNFDKFQSLFSIPNNEALKK